MVDWELDLWYEIWDRAGSEGLDTWHEMPEKQAPGAANPAPDVAGGGPGKAEGGALQPGPVWEGG